MLQGMNVDAMQSGLVEGMEDVEHLHSRIHYLRTGKRTGFRGPRLPFEERHHPLSEGTLEVTLEHAMRHLNWMWNERRMSRDDWNAPGYDAGETAKFPKGLLPLKGDNAPQSHYERYVRWAKKNKAVEKPITSLPELVAKAFLTDPQYRNFPRWEGLVAGAFYPDFGERVRYCREKQPGWEDLAETLGEALRENAYWRQENFRDQLPQNVSFAMEKGDPANFLINLAISGFHFTRQWLQIVIESRSFLLLRTMIRRSPELFRVITPRRLLLRICADGRFPDDESSKLIRALEAKVPGIVSSTVDVFGDTPLWYTFYRYQYGGHRPSLFWKEDSAKTRRTLIALGCDPDRKNKMGLSWRDVKCVMKR